MIADEEQIFSYNEIKISKHEKMSQEKINFSGNLVFIFNGGEKVLNAFKGNLFSKVIGDNAHWKTLHTPSNISTQVIEIFVLTQML